jgi:hypothetical protein
MSVQRNQKSNVKPNVDFCTHNEWRELESILNNGDMKLVFTPHGYQRLNVAQESLLEKFRKKMQELFSEQVLEGIRQNIEISNYHQMNIIS